MANFRGKGGSGAIDGFMFALSLVPTVMFALAMITVFEHYGALKAARKILTPVLRPAHRHPRFRRSRLIASMQSTDGGAALTRQLKDAGELTESETNTFAAFQMTADAPITNFFSSGAVLFTLVAADARSPFRSAWACASRHPARQGSLRQHDAPPPDPRLPQVTTNVKNRRRNKNVRT